MRNCRRYGLFVFVYIFCVYFQTAYAQTFTPIVEYEGQSQRGIWIAIFFIVIACLLIFITLQMYIRDLRKRIFKINKALADSYQQLELARQEQAATDQKLKTQYDHIHLMAYYDSLTGLPNRMMLMDKLDAAIADARTKSCMISVMFLDLDNFKTINDTLGHTYGDLLLKNVGEMLQRYLKDNEMVARLGGDELVIVQSDIYHLEQVTSLANRIITSLHHPWILDDREFYVSSSIGIAIYPNDGQDEHALLKNADTAMYYAKEMGKNTWQLFNQSMNTRIMERLEIENNLRHALEKNGFTVVYQPQIDINTGEIVGAEALIRWIHPTMGIISPVRFIPVAEETGLIASIGEWVLRTACIQNRRWQEKGLPPICMAVNLSARQFQQQGLVELVARTLKDADMAQKWLGLEITETIAMQNLDNAIIILNKLQKLGVHISLDDFGTGYSSLNYLKRLPINTLKIDKSFVHDITINTSEQAIAKALISVAHSMNLDVVAEGVETEEQLEFLKKENCDKVQGYLFSKPVPAEEFEELLRKQMEERLAVHSSQFIG